MSHSPETDPKKGESLFIGKPKYVPTIPPKKGESRFIGTEDDIEIIRRASEKKTSEDR